eukprot:8980361-Alexandrium_andersonii.AAC.1
MERRRPTLSVRRARGSRCAEGAGRAAPSGRALSPRTARALWPSRAAWAGPWTLEKGRAQGPRATGGQTSATGVARMAPVPPSRSSS